MIEVFQAGWQGTKVRGLLWFSLAVCLGCLYWGYDMLQHLGLSPGDGGVLRPLWERIAWGGFISLFGLAFFTGMLFYANIYIRQVGLDKRANRVQFETIRLLRDVQFSVPPEDILGSRYHAGEMYTDSHAVAAPFYFVRLRGRKTPLILDGQGVFLEPGLAERLLDL